MIVVLLSLSESQPHQATIEDVADANMMLTTFFTMKGSAAALRQSADAAILLVKNLNIRGVGNGDPAAITWGIKTDSVNSD